MNPEKFVAVVFDDISDTHIACPGMSHTAVSAPLHNGTLACENNLLLDIPQEAPIPIANSGDEPMDPLPGPADAQIPARRPCSASPLRLPAAQMERGLMVGPYEYAYIVGDIWPQVNPQVQGEHPLLNIYTAVRKTCLPNYLSARIPIPSNINCDAWDHLLQGYHDAEIADFLRYGWPGGYTAPVPPSTSSTNHPSAVKFPDDVSRFLSKEVSLGAMLGPFPAPPFSSWSQVSPLMTVEKKDSAARRVIIDLSFPIGLGVNAGVPRNFFQGANKQYTLPSIHDLANMVIKMGKGCHIWKADLERAYRQLRCDPLDYPLLGVCHQGGYYTDICPSFGCRGSSMSQQRVSEAVCHLMAAEGHKVLAYVDDFCGIHRSQAGARAGYAAFGALTDTLGLKLAEDKSAPPSTTMEWLGFLFDTYEMTITLPPQKLQEIIQLASTWSAKSKASRRELQSLAGRLNHIGQCVLPARKFMGRILASLRSAPLQGLVPVDEGVRSGCSLVRRVCSPVQRTHPPAGQPPYLPDPMRRLS